MRITEFPHALTLAAPTAGYVRAPGLHASDLYGSFYKAFDPKRYDKKDKDGVALPFDLVKMELGTSFEEVLEPALAQRLFGSRPEAFTYHVDGCTRGEECQSTCIIYSPDYLFYDDDATVLGEFKLTWYSSRGFPSDVKFSKYFTQVKLYCYWLQLTRCRLYILFVNGDYAPPAPQLRAWELVFTQQELQDEHAMIMRHARKAGLIGS